MSQEHVRVVEAGLDAFNGRDVDRFASLATEDFVWMPGLPGAVASASYVGRDGIERYFAESSDTWEELTVLAEQLRDLGGRVLLLGQAVGRGRGSGATVRMPFAFIAEFRGERLARVAAYLSHEQALKAAGVGA